MRNRKWAAGLASHARTLARALIPLLGLGFCVRKKGMGIHDLIPRPHLDLRVEEN